VELINNKEGRSKFSDMLNIILTLWWRQKMLSYIIINLKADVTLGAAGLCLSIRLSDPKLIMRI
jgi:hypothetical protein